MDMSLRSLVQSEMTDYVKFVSKAANNVYINDVVNEASEKIGKEITDTLIVYDDRFRALPSNTSFVTKRNKYNLVMYNDRIKIKVFLGVNAKVAKYNAKWVKHFYPHDQIFESIHSLRGNGFYIETAPFYAGLSLRDVFEDETYKLSFDEIIDLLADFVHRKYKPNEDDMICGWTDLQPDNFIFLNHVNHISLIDFDHIGMHKRDKMYDEIAHNFVQYVYHSPKELKNKMWQEHCDKYSFEETVQMIRDKL